MKIKTKIAISLSVFAIALGMFSKDAKSKKLDSLLFTKSFASDQKVNSNNVLGFFAWLKTVKPNEANEIDRAINILSLHPNYTNYNHIEDASSIKNIKKSFDILSQINYLRTTDKNFPGLSALGTSHRMLAIAISNANNSLTYDMGHLHHFKVGENLSWSPKEPIEIWHTDEIAIYNKDKNPNSDDVAHYLNIVSKYYNITALAINNKRIDSPARVVAEVFNKKINAETVYTINEYKNLINQYENNSFIPNQNTNHTNKTEVSLNKQSNISKNKNQEIKNLIKNIKVKLYGLEFIKTNMPHSYQKHKKQITIAIERSNIAIQKAQNYLEKFNN